MTMYAESLAPFVSVLGRTSGLLIVAAFLAELVLRQARIHAPRWHRVAWMLVLSQGWIVAKWTWEIPWLAPKSLAPTAIGHVPSPPSWTPGVVETNRERDATPPFQASGNTVTTATIGGRDWEVGTVVRLGVVGLWLAGMGGWLTIYWLRHVRWTTRLKCLGRAPTVDQAHEWNALQQQVLGRVAVPMLVTGGEGPYLAYIGRRVTLVVPSDFWHTFNTVQRHAMLRHELAHHARGDLWKGILARLVAWPQWFNPAAWWALRQFDEAAEWSCDRAACPSPLDAIEFAKGLLRLAESHTPKAGLVSAARGRGIVTRVERLFHPPEESKEGIMKRSLLLTTLLALIALSATGIRLVARADESPARDDLKQKVQETETPKPTESLAPISIHGTVLDNASGQPIAGANITGYFVLEQEPRGNGPARMFQPFCHLIADGNGHFQLKRVLPEMDENQNRIIAAYLRVSSPDNATFVQRFVLLNHHELADVRVVTKLDRGVRVTGRLLYTTTGNPRAGFVWIFPAISNKNHQGAIDESSLAAGQNEEKQGDSIRELFEYFDILPVESNGTFSTVVGPGRHLVAVTAPGTNGFQLPDIARLKPAKPLNASDFCNRITGKPLQHFEARRLQGVAEIDTTNEVDGRFFCRLFAADDVINGTGPREGHFPLEFRITSVHGPAIEAKFSDGSGHGIGRVAVGAMTAGFSQTHQTDESGVARLDGPDPTHPLVLFAVDNERRLGLFDIVYHDPQAVRRVCVMKPLAKVRGRLLDQQGKPLANVGVYANSPEHDGWPVNRGAFIPIGAPTTENGEFELSLPAGTRYDLVVRHRTEHILRTLADALRPGESHSLGTLTLRAYQPPNFNGRLGQIRVQSRRNTGTAITIWHSQGPCYSSWPVAAGTTRQIDAGKGFVFGDDWGIQIGDGTIEPLSKVATYVPGAGGNPGEFQLVLPIEPNELAAR